MPLEKLKFTFDYCKSNLASFILVLIMIFLLNQTNILIPEYQGSIHLILIMAAVIIGLIFHGYGLVVTKDNINNGKSLPKVPFYRSFVFGVKSAIIVSLYGTIQYFLYFFISVTFNFPFIEISEGKIAISNLNSLFYAHGSLDTILYILLFIISTYLFIFFLEISLARLADKGSLIDSLNILSIEKCISTIGWVNYAVDYTKLIISIAILAYIQYGLNFIVTHPIINLFIGLIMFIIQYIGIGRIYRTYLDKRYGKTFNRP